MLNVFDDNIKRSDEILLKAEQEGRGLTKSERHELREAYVWEKEEERKSGDKLKRRAEEFKEEDTLLPRHIMQGKCAWFAECPLDFKCRNYDPKYVKCVNCPLHATEGICHKRELHNDKNIAMMITRPKVVITSE